LADANPYPTAKTCTPDSGAIYQDNSGYTACIDDQQLQSEVQGFLTAHSLPNDLAHLYLVFLPKAAESCFTALNGSQGGECSINPSSLTVGGFCGYHSFSGIYASMPFPIYNSPIGFTCSPQFGPGNQTPNGNLDADVEISVTSHEVAESITDPTAGGWYDSSGTSGEIGDDCNFVYGGGFGGSAGAFYNQTINGTHYFTQEEFGNEDFNTNSATSCIQREESPAALFAVTTGSPTAGSPVNFNGASSNDPDVTSGIVSYSWNFGDFSPAGTGATPSHSYASAGSFTVVLTVTDIDGWQATVSHQITIRALTPGGFGSLAPSRLLDTRFGVGAPKAPVAAGGTVHLQVLGRGGVPVSGVSAVVLNVTVTAPTKPGYLTVYGDGSARPGASNLNFVAGQTVPNLVIAPVGANGKVDLYNGSAGTVQLIADVSGYYLG
jgi:PKD repeat protein